MQSRPRTSLRRRPHAAHPSDRSRLAQGVRGSAQVQVRYGLSHSSWIPSRRACSLEAARIRSPSSLPGLPGVATTKCESFRLSARSRAVRRRRIEWDQRRRAQVEGLRVLLREHRSGRSKRATRRRESELETVGLNDDEKSRSSLIEGSGRAFVKTSTGSGPAVHRARPHLSVSSVGADMVVKASGGVRSPRTGKRMVPRARIASAPPPPRDRAGKFSTSSTELYAKKPSVKSAGAFFVVRKARLSRFPVVRSSDPWRRRGGPWLVDGRAEEEFAVGMAAVEERRGRADVAMEPTTGMLETSEAVNATHREVGRRCRPRQPPATTTTETAAMYSVEV